LPWDEGKRLRIYDGWQIYKDSVNKEQDWQDEES
jgi:hypothetical protein